MAKSLLSRAVLRLRLRAAHGGRNSKYAIREGRLRESARWSNVWVLDLDQPCEPVERAGEHGDAIW